MSYALKYADMFLKWIWHINTVFEKDKYKHIVFAWKIVNLKTVYNLGHKKNKQLFLR